MKKILIVIALELESCQLPLFKLYSGPCLGHEGDRIHGFIKKHLGRGFGPWIDYKGCMESLDPRREVNVLEVISERWSEFTVSPHLKTIKPVVELLNEEVFKKLSDLGATRWLRDFILKKPSWMEYCTS